MTHGVLWPSVVLQGIETFRFRRGCEFMSDRFAMPILPPSTLDALRAMFSSEKTIDALAKTMKRWEEKTPENMHLVVTLKTPDDRVMVVATVKPTGWQSFVAEGYVYGTPCMIAGHIANLLLFCSYEEATKSRSAVGFRFVPPEPVSEPEPESEQSPRGNA